MSSEYCDGYLDEIQERLDGDVFKAMLEAMARRVMEEEMARHLGLVGTSAPISAVAIAMDTSRAA
jgi:hypothetical protein